jgi:hypothetical protein
MLETTCPTGLRGSAAGGLLMGGERSFTERLELARHLVAHGSTPPAHELDQLDAAARETREQIGVVGVLLTLAQPTRGWRHAHRSGTPEQQAYLTAALLGCRSCIHIRRSGPQPVVATLALRRIDCRRCANTLRRPSADDGNRCEMCDRRGISWFVPFVAAMGPLLVAGDVCQSCARILNVAEATA